MTHCHDSRRTVTILYTLCHTDTLSRFYTLFVLSSACHFFGHRTSQRDRSICAALLLFITYCLFILYAIPRPCSSVPMAQVPYPSLSVLDRLLGTPSAVLRYLYPTQKKRRSRGASSLGTLLLTRSGSDCLQASRSGVRSLQSYSDIP